MQLKEDFLFDHRYLLIKYLGSGAFSDVWLVEDTKVGNKKMALKVYAPERGLDEEGVKLFSKEFELVFDLNHTSLLRPAHFDVFQRSPYLLLPYCELGSANRLVGSITEKEAWRLLHQVASGLCHLHELEPPIIHRGIKPSNILIDHAGNFLITDFGISLKARRTLRKSMGEAKSSLNFAYTPPEQFEKNIWIKASDIWALGATMFELLVGDVPFFDPFGGRAQLDKIPIPEITGDWSPHLKKIVTLCLQKEAWDRPKATQMVQWAEEHLEGRKLTIPIREETKVRHEASELISTPKHRATHFFIYILICILSAGIGFLIWRQFAGGEEKPVVSQVISHEEQPIEPTLIVQEEGVQKEQDMERERQATLERERQATLEREQQAALEREQQAALERERQATLERERQTAHERQRKADLASVLDRANRAFTSYPPNENEAFLLYQKAVELDPNDFTGYHAFIKRAKAIYEALGVYDARIKGLFLQAQALQDTEEVRSEIAKCP